MSGDSKDSDLGGEDLLSELLDLEDEGDHTEVLSSPQELSEQSFEKKTETLTVPSAQDSSDQFDENEKTEFLSKPSANSDEETRTEKIEDPSPPKDELENFLFEDDEKTEFSQDVERQALEIESSSDGLEDFSLTDGATEAQTKDDLADFENAISEITGNEDKPSLDIEEDTVDEATANEMTIPPELENPFEQEEVEKTINLDAADVVLEEPPFESPPQDEVSLDQNVDSTALDNSPPPSEQDLVEPLQELSDDSIEQDGDEVDPIDAALQEFSNDNRKSQMEGAQAEGFDDPSSGDQTFQDPGLENLASLDADSESDQSTAEAPQSEPSSEVAMSEQAQVSSEDFADVFQSGPIEIPQEPARRSAIFSNLNGGHLKILAASLFAVFALGSLVYLLKTDEGLVGYRLEGFSLAPAYRAPSEEDLKDFAKIMKVASEARRLDSPEKLQESIPALESILIRDERNFEGASELLEVLARVLSWKGVDPQVVAKFDETLKKIDQIHLKIDREIRFEQVERAKAWKALALNEFSKSREQLLSLEKDQSGNLESETYELLFELNYRAGAKEAAGEIISKVEKPSSRRFRFFEALLSGESKNLRGLAAEAYLPAEIEVQLAKKVENKSVGRELLAKANRIYEEVKVYPWLVQKVRSVRGDIYAAVGEPERARDEWAEVVAQFPEASEIWEKLALSYQAANQWDKSLEAFDSAIKTGGVRVDLVVQYTKLLRKRNKIVEALSIVERGLQEFPKSVSLYFQQGLNQMTIFQDESAKKSFDMALELNPKYEPAIVAQANLAVRREEYAEADKLFAQVPESSDSYSDALLGRGQLAMRRFELDEASRLYGQAIRVNSTNVSAYVNLTKLLIRKGKLKEAEALNRSAKEKLPENPYIAASLASVFVERNKFDQAESIVEPFLKSHSHVSDVWMIKADIQIERGNYSSAREILDRLEEDEINNGDVNYYKAKLFYSDDSELSPLYGGRDSAESFIGSALNINPSSEKYLILASKIERKKDERDDARDYLQQALKHYPDSWKAHAAMGELEYEQGNLTDALKSYTQAERLGPFKGQIYSKMAQVYRAQGDAKNALIYYQRTLKWYPGDAQVRLEVGKLLNEEGAFVNALQQLQKAVRLNPNLAEAYYYIGFIQKELGNNQLAIKSFKRYLDKEPNGVESATVQDEVYFLEQQVPN